MPQKSSFPIPQLFEFEIPNFSDQIRAIVIFDRDDTLIKDIPGLAKPDDIVWMPGVKESLRLLHQNQIACLVASNQRAIASKTITLEELSLVSNEMFNESVVFGGSLSIFAYCTHEIRKTKDIIIYSCKCRKPQPGLIDYLIKVYQFPNIPIFFVGDKDTDRQAAATACRKIKFLPSSYLEDPLKLLNLLLEENPTEE